MGFVILPEAAGTATREGSAGRRTRGLSDGIGAWVCCCGLVWVEGRGGDYAARALMLDRSTVQALAWGPALLAYLSFVVGVGLLIVSLRAHRDA